MTDRVLVTDAARGSALAVIRSLGRLGWDVVAADTRPDTMGAASRYASTTATYPSPFTGPVDATVDAVFDLVRQHRCELVVPVTDDVLVGLAARRDEVPAGCTIAMAGPTALAAAADKVETVELARRLDVPVPATEVLTDADGAAGVTGRLGRPVVVKPARSRVIGPDGIVRRAEVTYAWDDEEVAAAAAAAGQPVLVQAYHRGVGHGIGMVLDGGRPLIAVQHRRLHEVPITGGASALRETVPLDPALLAHATALLGALEWTGAAMVEFKVGGEGATVMEVNGRLWGSLPLAVHAGADIPAALAAVHLGRPLPGGGLDTGYRVGVRSRNLDLELLWIASVLRGGHRHAALGTPRRREGIAAAAGLVRRGQRDDVLCRDDPRPGVTGVRDAVTHLTRKVRNGR